MMDALKLAILFHETYERLAPDFGYETRTETRKFDPTTPNGRLMVAVCGEILESVFVATLEVTEGEFAVLDVLVNDRPPAVIETSGGPIAIL